MSYWLVGVLAVAALVLRQELRRLPEGIRHLGAHYFLLGAALLARATVRAAQAERRLWALGRWGLRCLAEWAEVAQEITQATRHPRRSQGDKVAHRRWEARVPEVRSVGLGLAQVRLALQIPEAEGAVLLQARIIASTLDPVAVLVAM